MTETAADLKSLERAILNEIALQEQALGGSQTLLRAARLRAMRDFAATGLPRRNAEAWRWTDLSPLPFIHARAADGDAPDPGVIAGPFHAIDAWRLVFVNGEFNPGLSSMDNLPEGIRAGPLLSALRERPWLAEHLSDADDAPFLTMNTALLHDGAFLEVSENQHPAKPFHLVFLNSGNRHIRNLVLLRPNSRAVILESHDDAQKAAKDAGYFVNYAANIVIARNARLVHYRDQNEHPAAAHFYYQNTELQQDSAYHGFILAHGARLSRNEAHIHINGAGAECRLAGVNLLSGAQTADTCLVMDHLAPDGESLQKFRTAASDEAKGIFQGIIKVRKDAQRTDARQEIKALLLSPRAAQYAKPELEILADDVQCAHGASAGQLDESALFYLRARGIGAAQARALLTCAFLEEALAAVQQDEAGLDQVHGALRAVIREGVFQQMGAPDA